MTDSTADSPGKYPGRSSSRRYAAARKRTTALFRGLRLILSEHNCPHELIQSLERQVHSYLDIWSEEGLWVSHAKSLLTHPFSQYLRNEPPAAPSAGIFKPKGAIKRWLKARLISFNKKNTHLWSSWLQAKRCCLPASKDQVEASYLKHRQILTKEDDGCDETIERILSNPSFVEHLDHVRGGILRSYLFNDSIEESYRPSLRSCLSHTRGEGGAIANLRSGMAIYKNSLGICLEPSQLESMRFERKLYPDLRGGVVTKLCVTEQRSYHESLQIDWVDSIHANSVYQYHLNNFDPLECKITGIIEPLKVRVISRGPAKEYYLCKKLQKTIHNVMRQMPAYTLIGRPLLGGDTMTLKRPEGTEWFSIDYSAATDNLSYKYSRKIFDYIIQDLPNSVRTLASKVLGLHRMEYPDGSRAQMRRGQLMGSILSFPVLCLANMGVYLDVTNEYQAGWNAADRTSSVFINGDDQLYAAPRSLWPRHAAVSNAVGLELSVGKAYIHPEYLNINSTSVHHRFGSTPWQIDYLNTGLFFGQSKVLKTLDESSENIKDTTTNLNRLLSGSLPGRSHILLAKFLRLVGQDNLDKEKTSYYYRRSFMGERGYVAGNTSKRRHTFVRDLFLPISLGGCGILKPLGFHTKRWKRIQNRVATAMFLQRINPTTLPPPARLYYERSDQHIPNYALESNESPARTVFPYTSMKYRFDTTLEYHDCILPKLYSGPVCATLTT